MILDRKKELDKLYWFLDLPPNGARIKFKVYGIERILNGIIASKKLEDSRVTFKIDSKEGDFSRFGIEYIIWKGRRWNISKPNPTRQEGFEQL